MSNVVAIAAYNKTVHDGAKQKYQRCRKLQGKPYSRGESILKLIILNLSIELLSRNPPSPTPPPDRRCRHRLTTVPPPLIFCGAGFVNGRVYSRAAGQQSMGPRRAAVVLQGTNQRVRIN